MFSLTMKNKVKFFFYCTYVYFELILYLSAVQFYLSGTLLKRVLFHLHLHLKNIMQVCQVFFYSSSLHVGFKKNVLGQIEIEPYVQQIETFVVRIFITMYLGHSNLHLGSTGYLKNY